jgi:hypothetical protein
MLFRPVLVVVDEAAMVGAPVVVANAVSPLDAWARR